MATSTSRIELQIAAESAALDNQLREALFKVDRFANEVHRKMGAGGGGGGEGGEGGIRIKLPRGLNELTEGAIGIHAVGAALGAAEAVASAFAGDWKKVEESVQGLPMGIGHIFKEMGGVLGALESIGSKTEEIAAHHKEIADQVQRIKTLEEEVEHFAKAGESQVNAKERMDAVGGKSGFEGDVAGIEFDHQKASKKITDDAETLRAEVQKEFHSNPWRLNLEMDDLNEKINARVEAEEADHQEKLRRANLAHDTVMANDDRAAGLRRVLLQDQIHAQELEVQGDHHEARKAMIDSSYRERIAAAGGQEKELLKKARDGEKAEEDRQNIAEEQEKAMREAHQRDEEREKQQHDKEKQEHDQLGIFEHARGMLEREHEIIANRKLAPEDAGFLTRGTDTSNPNEKLEDLQTKANEYLQKLAEDKANAQKLQLVGFN